MKAYLATHFFNQAGLEFTERLAEDIRLVVPGIDLYVPQENDEINDKSNDEVTATDISRGDNYYLDPANIIIVSLDGVEIDSGVSAEIGRVTGLIDAEEIHCVKPQFRKIIGLYTDIRRDGKGDNRFYINQYTKGLVDDYGVVVNSVDQLMEELQETVEEFQKTKMYGRKL